MKTGNMVNDKIYVLYGNKAIIPVILRVHSLVVSGLHLETEGSWFESGC